MPVANVKEKLIELFAAKTVEEIEQNSGESLKQAFGVGDIRGLSEDSEYKTYFEKLKAFAVDLDDIDGRYKGQEQVKECLRLIREENENNPDSVAVLSELIKKRFYGKKWNDTEKEYFDRVLEMLEEWKDFFFSYTNRNCIETNSDYKEILNHVFGSDFQENRESMNYLARLIVRYLVERDGLTAFYDKDNITCGDIIGEEIRNHCNSVFAFVQLVEHGIFKKAENQKNWCFEEFSQFTEWLDQTGQSCDNRYYFLLTEKIRDILPARFPTQYEKWREEIEKRHYEDLSLLVDNKDIYRQVKPIAKKIVETKKRILDGYID